MKPAQLIVVGGGIAGSAAALRAVQYHLPVIFIRGDVHTANRSRGEWVVNIDNMIGIHEGVIKPKLLKSLKGADFAAARAQLEQAHFHVSTKDIIDNTLERIQEEYADLVTVVNEAAVHAAREADGTFVVTAASGTYRAPYLVLATGVMDRQPLIKRARGQEIADDIKWIYPFANRESVLYCIRCEGHLTAGTHAAVIGSSEDTAQLALMLHERYDSACCVLTNGEAPSWEERTQRALDVYGLTVKTARIVDLSGAKGRLHTIALEDGGEVNVAFALISLGLFRVYNDLARELGVTLTDPDQPIDVRHVLIDARGETSVPGVFAVGDMARRADEPVMKQVYTSQEYAVRAVDAIDRRVRKKRREEALAGV